MMLERCLYYYLFIIISYLLSVKENYGCLLNVCLEIKRILIATLNTVKNNK